MAEELAEHKPTVLIVDDTPANIAVLDSILCAGYRLKVATSGALALKIANGADRPDLILLDVMMPEMDGYEVCRRLRAEPATAEIPVIFVTAKGQVEDEARGFAAGCVDYITKPVSPPIVLARVANHLDLAAQRRRLERQNAELDAARVQAQAATQAKSRFLAMMSHEIRTPLNGVLGMLELLSCSQLESVQRDQLQTACECAGTLRVVIDDILDYSKIEAGKLLLESVPVDLDRLFSTTLAALELRAAEKGLRLTYECELATDCRYCCDPTRIRQLLFNIVGNSIKFTQSGHVRVRLWQMPGDGREDHILIEISDSGIGIPSEALAGLFEPFQQAESDTTRRFGGTGLGLAICRQLVELMGGSMDMQSRPGEGTRTRIELWLKPTGQADRSHAPDSQLLDLEPIRARVLVVDDHPANRRVIAAQLAQLGMTADTAADGQEALRTFRQGEYDLILSDYHMPEMDGPALLAALRAEGGAGAKVPVVAITADVNSPTLAPSAKGDFAEWIEKPCTLAHMRHVLSTVLGVGAGSSAGTRKRDSASANTGKLLDLGELEAAFPDRALMREMLQEYLDSVAPDIAALRDALDAAQPDAVRRAAHRIKGAASMAGAQALAALALDIAQFASQEDFVELGRRFRDLETMQDEVCRAISERYG